MDEPVKKKQAARRTYMVLKRVAPEGPRPANTDPDVPEWIEVGHFDAGSEAQARDLGAKSLPEADQGGTYVALARWEPRDADPQPVTQTRLVWS